MPTINITLDDLIATAKATLISNTNAKVALAAGDPILALMQASCAADLMLVAALQSIIRLGRVQTRFLGDRDDWMRDFLFLRQQSTIASGSVLVGLDTTFNSTIVIPADGSLQVIPSSGPILFKVIADSLNPYYSATPSKGYYIPAGSLNLISIPVEALNPGSAANVAVGSLKSFSTPIAGVLTVGNVKAIANGKDVEGDDDFLHRFHLMMTSLASGNEDAISLEIEGVLGGGASYVLLEHTTMHSEILQGTFQIVAENGSGSLTTSEKTRIEAAVGKKKAFGIPFSVVEPGLLSVDASVVYLADPAFRNLKTQAEGAIVSEVAGYLNKRKIAQSALHSEINYRIMRLKKVYPNVVGVESINVGGKVNEDYFVGSTQVVRSSGVVSVSSVDVAS